MVPTTKQSFAAILFSLLLCSPLQSMAVSEETDNSSEQQAGGAEDSGAAGIESEDELDWF